MNITIPPSWPRRYRYRYLEVGLPEENSGTVLVQSEQDAGRVEARLQTLREQGIVASYAWEHGEPEWMDVNTFLVTLPDATDKEPDAADRAYETWKAAQRQADAAREELTRIHDDYLRALRGRDAASAVYRRAQEAAERAFREFQAAVPLAGRPPLTG